MTNVKLIFSKYAEVNKYKYLKWIKEPLHAKKKIMHTYLNSN